MKRTTWLLVIVFAVMSMGLIVMCYDAYADELGDLQSQDDQIVMSVQAAAAQVQLIDQQIKELLDKRQTLNRQIGIGQSQLSDIRGQIKALQTSESKE